MRRGDLSTGRRIIERDLDKLDNERLLDWIADARDAGRVDEAKRGIAVLLLRHEKRITKRVAVRTPPAYVEDVVGDVMESAIRSAFDGKFIGEFRAWLRQITVRRIADFHRDAERRPPTTLLPNEHEGDDDVWVELGVEDAKAAMLPYLDAAEKVLATRDNPIHRQVIRLYGPVELEFCGWNARDTKAEIERVNPGTTISEANIHQIWKRFKDDVEEALDDLGDED